METASALLAAVLLQRPGVALPSGDLARVLTAYSTAGFISVEDKVTGPAEAVVVLANKPYVDRDASGKNEAMVTIVDQFDKAGPEVVAGIAAGAGNLVSVVRGDPALAKTIPTVDNVQTVQGQLVTALATVEHLVSGKVGHYGNGSGATSLMPKLAGAGE